MLMSKRLHGVIALAESVSHMIAGTQFATQQVLAMDLGSSVLERHGCAPYPYPLTKIPYSKHSLQSEHHGSAVAPAAPPVPRPPCTSVAPSAYTVSTHWSPWLVGAPETSERVGTHAYGCAVPLTRTRALTGCSAVMASLRKSPTTLLLALCCMLYKASAVGAALPAWTDSSSSSGTPIKAFY